MLCLFNMFPVLVFEHESANSSWQNRLFMLLLLFHAIIFNSFPGSHLFSLFQMCADEMTLSVSEHKSASWFTHMSFTRWCGQLVMCFICCVGEWVKYLYMCVHNTYNGYLCWCKPVSAVYVSVINSLGNSGSNICNVA